MSRCRALTSCSPADRRVCNERDAQRENRPDRISPRTTSAGDPALLRGASAPSGARDAELRQEPAGPFRAGMPGTSGEPDHAAATGFQAADGKDNGELRSEAAASKSGAPSE